MQIRSQIQPKQQIVLNNHKKKISNVYLGSDFSTSASSTASSTASLNCNKNIINVPQLSSNNSSPEPQNNQSNLYIQQQKLIQVKILTNLLASA